MLWNEIKRHINTSRPENMSELQQFCEEDGFKVPLAHCVCQIEEGHA